MKFIEHSKCVKKAWIFLFKIGAKSGCHQMPDRSFKILDLQFPVCARCTGVILGQLGAVIGLIFHRKIDFKICIIFLFILFLDWLIQYLRIKKSNNIRRLISGVLGGIGLVEINIYVFVNIYKIIVIIFT